MSYFIPELRDRQPVARAGVTTEKGTGADSATYRVKGQRASAEQRLVIDAALGEAARLNASRRVMVAVVMCMTQESACQRLMHGDSARGDTLGAFQQGPEWISRSNVRNVALACRAFLLGHEANVGGRGKVQGWKQRHRSVRNAPGDLSAAIAQVQRPRRDLHNAYAQWADEAARTVDAWLGSDGNETSRRKEPYEFTRGERRGQREHSWAALARWAEDVGWHRWAEANVLFYVSDDELRASRPALEVHGDEPWLLSPPGYDWAISRPVTEITMRVLAERWGVRIGASVMVHAGPARGRFIVAATDGFMVAPELTVTLRRPATKRPEPAPETTTEQTSSSSGGSRGGLYEACRAIVRRCARGRRRRRTPIARRAPIATAAVTASRSRRSPRARGWTARARARSR